MAGTLTVDTLQSSTTGAPTFVNTNSTQIGQLCRGWVNFNGSTAVIRASFNFSSVIRNGTGNYTVNLTNAMPDVNFSAVGSTNYTQPAQVNCASYAEPTSTSTVVMRSQGFVNSAYPGDPTNISLAIFR